MSSDKQALQSPKSQIKLAQVINSNGAVAAVPQYYTRKQLPGQISPQVPPQLEISSQQQLSQTDEQLKMQITNLRNVVNAKKQTQILSARNNSNNVINFAQGMQQHENILTPRGNQQPMIQIREDSSKRLKQLVANASHGINRRAMAAAAQQKASSTPRGAIQSRQNQEGGNQDDSQPNSTTGSQSARNREINNAYLKKRLPNGIQLVNYQEKEKPNNVMFSPQIDLLQNKVSPQNLTDRKRDSTQKISIDGGNIPSDSDPNERVIKAVKESLKLIRKNGNEQAEEQLMSRRKQSQKKLQNQQHAIVHGSSSNEGGNSTDRGGQGTHFLATSEISGSLGSGSNGGTNMPALSGSMSMKNAQKGFLSSKGINLPLQQDQHSEIKLEFPYSNDRGIIAQVHIKLEDQNYKVYKNNNNNQSPPMVTSAQQSNLIMKLKKHSQKKAVLNNSGVIRPQGFQSQDFQNLPQQISPLNHPLQLSSGSLQKIKRSNFPARQLFPPETPRGNLSQLIPPVQSGNPTDMKKSMSKLNLKQILITDSRSQVQSIEDVHFVRVYSNIKQREILNKSDSVISQAASKFSNNQGSGGVRTKFDSKVQIVEELDKSLSIDY